MTFLLTNTHRTLSFLLTPSQRLIILSFFVPVQKAVYAISVLLVAMAGTVYSTVSLGNVINSKAARQTNAWLEWSLKPHSPTPADIDIVLIIHQHLSKAFFFPWVLTLWIISNTDPPKQCNQQHTTTSVPQYLVSQCWMLTHSATGSSLYPFHTVYLMTLSPTHITQRRSILWRTNNELEKWSWVYCILAAFSWSHRRKSRTPPRPKST